MPEPGGRPTVVLIGAILAIASGLFVGFWGVYFLLVGHALAQEGFFGALFGGILVALAVVAIVLGVLKTWGGGLVLQGKSSGRTMLLVAAIVGFVTGGPAVANVLGIVVVVADAVALVLLFQRDSSDWFQAHANRRAAGMG